MAERILVPLDGSTYSEAAVEYVNRFMTKLCPSEEVTVILLHVVSMGAPSIEMTGITGGMGIPEGPYDPSWLENLKEESKHYLEGAAKKLNSSSLAIKTKIVTGTSPAEEIIKAEYELECDLVVMATHGRSGLSRWAFGSVTEKVLRGGTVPVLLVRAKE